ARDRLAAGRGVGRGYRRGGGPPAGPLAAASPRARAGRVACAAGDAVAAGSPQPGARALPGRRTRDDRGARRPEDPRHALATAGGDGATRRGPRSCDRLPARRTHVAVVPRMATVQAVARPGWLREDRKSVV